MNYSITINFTNCHFVAYSFIELINYIFTIPDVKSFLSEHISQDPLEKYFGRQRQRGGVHENPTSHEFLKNNGPLRVVNSIRIETHRGNTMTQCRDNIHVPVYISTKPLQKRKRERKTSGKTIIIMSTKMTFTTFRS